MPLLKEEKTTSIPQNLYIKLHSDLSVNAVTLQGRVNNFTKMPHERL